MRKMRSVANKLGIDVHRLSKTEWQWSYDVEDFYPVDPSPRWGYGKPPHQKLNELLDKERIHINGIFDLLRQCADVLQVVPFEAPPDSTDPYWKNTWFTNFDVAAIVGLLLAKK